MPRKGTIKVRTGCLTCKIRRIKCDESKPNCSRCVDTGRRCDGYLRHVYSELPHRQPQPIRALFSRREDARAVQFFFDEVARSFWAPHNSSFWSHHILKICSSEEAIRHSIIAVSSIYEECSSQGIASAQTGRSEFFLHHFNAAVRQLRVTKDRYIVLVGCLIFVCIASIQRNREQANLHAKHGVRMFRAFSTTDSRITETIGPIFERLSMMPSYFGQGGSPPPLQHGPAMPPQLTSLDHAESLLEVLSIRAARLFRCGESYRHGALRGKPISAELLVSQQEIQDLIGQIRIIISQFDQQKTPGRYKDAWYFLFLIRTEICRIQVSTAFEPDELSYDKFLDTFRAITRLSQHPGCAMRLLALTSPDTELQPEIIYPHVVYFIATKCRDLATRLTALSLLGKYSNSHEADKCGLGKLYSHARRIIEVEHNLILNKWDQPIGQVEWKALPSEEARVLSTVADPHDAVRAKINGRILAGKPEGFIMRDSHNGLYFRVEFITMMSTDGTGKEEFIQLENSLIRQYVPLHEPTPPRLDLVSHSS
ncbi:hypothetical protein GQ53DRAFT_506415 [Thozetella sp. PMI_491]|nr:hypothetical protein GQ53DRAFT_506415 [Thozetella sp. PMI_491]